ncbi:MAG: Bifunctional polymyxin resistance protein ArnA [candidate division BRC1 bacterium ADurb.BinA292]|nr:MAG: Bifunctional polymyxin resistance protein ArnA [candidate division BRC1 bacterium ADurb.BinA292]
MAEAPAQPVISRPRVVILTSGLDNLPARLLLRECGRRSFRPAAVVIDPIIRRRRAPEPSLLARYGRMLRAGMGVYAARKLARGLRRRFERPDNPRLPWLDILAERQGVPLIQTTNVNRDEGLRRLRETAPEILVMMGCRILWPEALAVAPLALNFHTGLLPDYRGADTLYWALARGDHERIGFTIHRAVEAVDAGEVYYEEAVAPLRGELIEDLFRRCCERAAPHWFDLFAAFARDGKLEGRALDLTRGTRYWGVDWWAVAHAEHAWMKGRQPAWVPENAPPAEPAQGPTA